MRKYLVKCQLVFVTSFDCDTPSSDNVTPVKNEYRNDPVIIQFEPQLDKDYSNYRLIPDRISRHNLNSNLTDYYWSVQYQSADLMTWQNILLEYDNSDVIGTIII